MAPLVPLEKRRLSSQHQVSPSPFFSSSSSHTSKHNYTTQTLTHTVTLTSTSSSTLCKILFPHVMWSAQAVRESKIDHINHHLCLVWNPKHVISRFEVPLWNSTCQVIFLPHLQAIMSCEYDCVCRGKYYGLTLKPLAKLKALWKVKFQYWSPKENEIFQTILIPTHKHHHYCGYF